MPLQVRESNSSLLLHQDSGMYPSCPGALLRLLVGSVLFLEHLHLLCIVGSSHLWGDLGGVFLFDR